jgi:hypothetical protein
LPIEVLMACGEVCQQPHMQREKRGVCGWWKVEDGQLSSTSPKN